MTPGKEQETIIPIEIHSTSGPQAGQARIQKRGLYLSGNKTEELGITWEELRKLLQNPLLREFVDNQLSQLGFPYSLFIGRS